MKHNLIMIVAVFATILFWQPQSAMAAACDTDKKVEDFTRTPTPTAKGEYIQALIPCIEKPIHDASILMLDSMSKYMKDIVTIMGALAIVFFGIKVIGGEMEIGDAASFLLRFGLVILFSYNLGNFGEAIYDILKQLLTLVTGSTFSPWADMDNFIGKAIGFANASKTDDGVKTGIFALLDGSLTDKVMGFLLFVVGMMTLLALLSFAFEATFLYLHSFMALGFLLIISPLIIPLAFFGFGDRHVRIWLNILIVTILTPVIMFGFLWMFMDIFKTSVDAIFAILDSEYVAKYLRSTQPLSHQTLTTDWTVACDEIAKHVNKTDCTQEQILASSRNSLDAQSFSNNPFNIAILEMNGMNGKTDLQNKKELLFALFNVWFFTTIMKHMIAKVPEVAASIGEVEHSAQVGSLMASPLAHLTRKFTT